MESAFTIRIKALENMLSNNWKVYSLTCCQYSIPRRFWIGLQLISRNIFKTISISIVDRDLSKCPAFTENKTDLAASLQIVCSSKQKIALSNDSFLTCEVYGPDREMGEAPDHIASIPIPITVQIAFSQ